MTRNRNNYTFCIMVLVWFSKNFLHVTIQNLVFDLITFYDLLKIFTES